MGDKERLSKILEKPFGIAMKNVDVGAVAFGCGVVLILWLK